MGEEMLAEKQLCRLGDWYSKERKRYYNRMGGV